MRRVCALAFILLVSAACPPVGPRTEIPPPSSVEVVPDGDAVGDAPIDPAVAGEQAELSRVDESGRDLPAIVISTLGELDSAGLESADAESEPFLEVVQSVLREGIEDATYTFVLAADRSEPLFPNLRVDGLPLLAVVRIDREVPTCTTWVSTELAPNEDLAGYGGRVGTATEGICGGIAAMHSFLRLGAVRRAAVVDGDNFKERPLRRVQGRNRKQMTVQRLRRLHEAAGASVCRLPGGVGFPTTNRGALTRFNRELGRFVNDPNRTWDCTLFVRTRQRGRDVLAHFEHVTAVSTSGGRTRITTINGFDQGNQTDKVPVTPGANTWTSEPGGTPPFSLTASDGRNGGDLVRGIPNVGLVNYLCCRRP